VKIAAAAARRFVSAPDKDVRAVLLYGPNRAVVSEYAQTLANHALAGTDDPFALTRLQEDEVRKDKARLEEALTAQSLLGGPRVVVARIDGESANESLLPALAAIESGAGAAYFIIEGGELAGKGKLVAAFENAKSAVAIACYEESEAERAAFLRQLIDAERVPMSNDARELFIAEAHADRAVMRGELEKIALFAHDLGRPVEPEDLAALSAVSAESALDDATGAATAGYPGKTLDALDRLEATSGISLLKALERRLLRLLEARTLVDNGVAPADAGDRLKPKVFWKERDAFAGQVRLWSAPRLLEALNVLWAAELRAKSAGAPQEAIAAAAYRRVAEIGAAARG
jgi:DNA polymerase III subunit delta